MTLDIGIVGAGFAGSAAALFLARDGHRVTIYEEAADPRAIGAGILMQPTGLAVLAELGLLERVAARGSLVRGIHCRTPGGRDLFDLSYTELEPRWFGLGLHRGALFESLFDAVREASISVVCGASVKELRARGKRHRPVRADGEELAEHDLVIVADGARSELRGHSSSVRRARQYPWGALWFVARDPELLFPDRLRQVARGTRRLVGFLPSGLGPERAPGRHGEPSADRPECPLVSLFWSVRLDRIEAWRSAGLGAWKREILALEPRAEALLSQIETSEQVLTASYFDVTMSRFHEPGLVFIGDAAHATSPQLGQGCNLALEDARVLAECLRESELDLALQRYSDARRRHVGYYQWASRALTPLFQSDHVALGWLRDAFMGLFSKAPVGNALMLRTLAGVQQGLFRRALPLAPMRPLLPGLESRERT